MITATAPAIDIVTAWLDSDTRAIRNAALLPGYNIAMSYNLFHDWAQARDLPILPMADFRAALQSLGCPIAGGNR